MPHKNNNTLIVSKSNDFLITNAVLLKNIETTNKDDEFTKMVSEHLLKLPAIDKAVSSIGKISERDKADVDYINDFILEAYCLTPKEELVCPQCNSSHIYKERTTEKTYKHIQIVPEKNTYIVAKIRSFECQECKTIFSDSVPFGYEHNRITNNASSNIKRLFSKGVISNKHIEGITNFNTAVIKNITLDYMNYCIGERQDYLDSINYKPRFLCVDEFSLQKNYVYGTTVMDYDTREILWATQGKKKTDFQQFYDVEGKDRLSDVAAFAMDMNAGYSSVVIENNPNTDIVYDKFHLFQKYNTDVLNPVRNEVRRAILASKKQADLSRSEIKEINKKASNVKSAKNDLATHGLCTYDEKSNSFTCSEDSEAANKLKELLNEYEDLGTVYKVKERMVAAYNSEKSYDETYKEWKELFKMFSKIHIPSLQKFAKNMLKKVEGIAAYAKHKITSGPIEGMNNLIKVCKRIAYGYKDFGYFFTLIRFRSLPKEWQTGMF